MELLLSDQNVKYILSLQELWTCPVGNGEVYLFQNHLDYAFNMDFLPSKMGELRLWHSVGITSFCWATVFLLPFFVISDSLPLLLCFWNDLLLKSWIFIRAYENLFYSYYIWTFLHIFISNLYFFFAICPF